jgi:outer membrane murein-binding lipoprotein Lpp
MKKMILTAMILSTLLTLTGCVSGNKAEVNALKIEKQSAASEVDQYVTTAGRIIDRLTRKDAEQ